MEEFERVQAGLSARSSGLGEKIVGRKDGKITIEQDVEGGGGDKGAKRKLEFDEAELQDLANSSKSRKKGDNSSSQDLPSFWVPGKIPAAQKAALKPPKQHPTCPAAAADQPHDISLKSLVTVHFTSENKASTADSTTTTPATRTCPSCSKPLSNATKAVLAKPCGHVLCKPCSDKFQRVAEKSAHDKEHDDAVRCYVCQEDVTAGWKVKKSKAGQSGKEKEKDKAERGLVELKSDGTGFAGGGANMVKRQGVAFQC